MDTEPRVGLLTVDICVPEAMTLKDKRQVVRSLMDRLANRFNVSVAQIGGLDSPRRGRLAFSVVSNDGGHAREMLDEIMRAVEGEPRLEVEESGVEVF
jgi:uncharacterized protein